LIVLNTLFPIFSLLVFGKLLRWQGLTSAEFLNAADRLIYFFFFPLMLFWKIGGASFAEGVDYRFCAASLAAVLAMFVLSTCVILMFGITPYKAGSFSQSCYRFNTYIGMAVVLNCMGGEGVRYFGVLIGFAIPLINVFAVSVLIWFSGKEISTSRRFAITARALLVNPLILSCIAGLFYSRVSGGFPVFIDNAFSLVSMAALPLALISIGGSLTLKGVGQNLGLATAAAVMKLLVLPVIAYGSYWLFKVSGMPLKVGMIFFSLPASTAIYVLSAQLSSDTELASAAILISTVLSFVSLSVVLLLF
jgi:predicted permease